MEIEIHPITKILSAAIFFVVGVLIIFAATPTFAEDENRWDYCESLEDEEELMDPWCTDIANQQWEQCENNADWDKEQCDADCEQEEPQYQAACYDDCQQQYEEDIDFCKEEFCSDMWVCFTLIDP